MSSTKQWLQCVGIVIAIACASAAPSLHPDAGSGVLSQPGQAIRRFDGTVAAEARPTSRNTIRSLFGSLWSTISKRISSYETKSDKLFKGLFASRRANEIEGPSPFLEAPASNKMDDLKEVGGMVGNPDEWARKAAENPWLASLKKLEEDEQALTFVGSLVDKVENFLTAKIHAGEKSLLSFIVKKAIVDSADKEADLNTAARENGSAHKREIAKFILEKVKHTLVAHFLNGSRDGNGEAVKAFGSSLIFTIFDLVLNSLGGPTGAART